MARLPDVQSLGARPVPVSRRQVATVRNAGAVGEAVAGLGETAARIGEQRLEREDRLSYAAAKTALLKADISAREELRDDPDYETYEKRYQEKMANARQQSASLIKSRFDRRLFEVDTAMDVERGAAEIRRMARDKDVASKVATLDGGLTDLQGVGRSAMDDATREQTIKTAGELVDGAVQSGVIDAAKGMELKRNWSSGYTREQIVGAIDRGEIATARGIMARFGKYLNSDEYISLSGAIDEEEDGRAIMAAADIATGGKVTLPDSVEALPDAGPLRMPVQGRITSQVGDARPGGRSHNGLDIAVPIGTVVSAPADGVVAKVWNDKQGGLSIQVDHGGGLVTGYAHLSSQDVKVGQTVRAGEVLAKSGNTGVSTGPHLHWTARLDGKPVDPRIAKRGGTFDTLENAIERGIAALGPNATPKQVESLRRELASRFQIRKQAEDDREEGAVEAAQAALVKNGGNWYALPASLRRSIPAKYHPGLINFGEGLQPSAPARKTDPETYVRLSDMAATDPAKFAAINPIEYRDKMDDGDWNRFVGMRAEIRGSRENPETVPFGNIRSITAPMLRSVGITMDGAKDKDKPVIAARQVAFEKAILGDIAIWQANNPGKKPSSIDIQKMADRRLIMMTPATGGDPVPQFEARGPSKVRIPTAEISRIRSLMAPVLGRDPTEQEIVQAYLREARGGQ